MNVSEGSFADYLADNTTAFLFTTIVSYNLLSINNRALDRSEHINEALKKSNDEYLAAMEELTATNEEFEAQNEELVRSDEALRASEADLLAIFNSSHDAMFVNDIDGTILDINERVLEMYNLEREQALKMNIRDLCASGTNLDEMQEAWKKVAAGEKSLFEMNAVRPRSGMTFPVEVGLRHMNRRGRTLILATVRDITLRKGMETALIESLEEKNILIKEIHHRVKNNMQIVSSLLNMQVDSIEEPVANQALKDAVGRIHSIASIHERIYRSDNFSRVDMAAYIEELSGDLLSIYTSGSKPIVINHQLKNVYLDLSQAIPCGLLINEILTNSIKHGCSDHEECHIDISIEESDGRVTLVIADYGPGFHPEIFQSERKTSMGMQIIEALIRQIEATAELSVENGARFTIRFKSAE